MSREAPLAIIPIEQAAPSSSWSLSSFLPTFSQVVNVSHAYYNFGPAYAVPLAGSSVVDNYFSTTFGGRNYTSLTAFWGGISYQAIKVLKDAKLSPTVKLSLTALIPVVAGYMVFRGTDIFKDDTNIPETFKAAKLTASFFDEAKSISQIEDGFREGYASGALALFKNVGGLASNKFIQNAVLEQSSYFLSSWIVQNYFSKIVFLDKAAILAAEKSGFKADALKDGMMRFVKFAIEAAHKKVSGSLSSATKHEIDVKMGHLLLESDTETILRLGNDVKQLPSLISTSYLSSSDSASKIIQLVCFNKIFSNRTTKGKIFYEEYPTLVLGEAAVGMAMYFLNQFTKWAGKLLLNDKMPVVEGTEQVKLDIQGFGNIGTVTTTSSPESYVNSKIQEIAKLGGNQFMLGKLIKYLNQKYKYEAAQSVDQNIIEVMSILKIVLSNLFFELQHSAFNLPDGLRDDLSQLDKTFDLLKALSSGNIQVNPISVADQAEATLKALRTKSEHGVHRKDKDSLVLHIENYDLKVTETAGNVRHMLHIDGLDFVSGKIYALFGKNGVGKTTLLTDIARCMAKGFSSSGEIEYPATESGKLPLVFCGSEAFTPPATTLLERLTYRLPEDYRLSHQEELLAKAEQLFTNFGHGRKFTRALLEEKSNNDKLELSEGQKQLVTLIAAIIYKQFHGSPVLFVMDESMSKLDTDRGQGAEFEEGTVSKVHRAIKKFFGDSIVISVDHYSANFPQFYDESINLQTYVPLEETHEVQVLGGAVEAS